MHISHGYMVIIHREWFQQQQQQTERKQIRVIWWHAKKKVNIFGAVHLLESMSCILLHQQDPGVL